LLIDAVSDNRNFQVGGRSMYIARSALAFIASCVLGMLPPRIAFAADLTLASASANSQTRPVQLEAAQKKNAAKTRKRAARVRQAKKISTYSLLTDPGFRYGIGVSGKPRFSADRGMGLGTGIDTLNPSSASPFIPSPSVAPPIIRTDPLSSAGSFDCPDKPRNPGPGRREMTACYVHKVDKSWKTQTYLTKRSVDGNTAWGGGLAVGYDY
jgi:hypothetical protein